MIGLDMLDFESKGYQTSGSQDKSMRKPNTSRSRFSKAKVDKLVQRLDRKERE